MKTNGRAPDLVGVRAAARAVGLNPSTVSRYLRDNPELNLGDGMHPKIDVAALRRHRADNTNPGRRGSHAVRPYSASRAKREAVLADRAQIDLDEKRGLLVPRAEVENAAFEIGTLLQRDLLELGTQIGERLSIMTEPQEIVALLESEHRRILAAMSAKLDAKDWSRCKITQSPA